MLGERRRTAGGGGAAYSVSATRRVHRKFRSTGWGLRPWAPDLVQRPRWLPRVTGSPGGSCCLPCLKALPGATAPAAPHLAILLRRGRVEAGARCESTVSYSLPATPVLRPPAELEDANRKLTAAADAASRDEREVAELVDKHHKLLESCKEMQVGGG